MSATVPSNPTAADPAVLAMIEDALCGQERLRATLSPEEYRQHRQERIAEFNRLCERASAEAEANGLTEEILAEILAEE